MSSLIQGISIIGLILSMIGTTLLVKPFILSNKTIEKICSYKDTGSIWGAKTKTRKNRGLINNFQEARDQSFEGISYIFVGFSLQLIQYIPLLEWYNIIIELIFIGLADWIILSKMKKKKELLIKG